MTQYKRNWVVLTKYVYDCILKEVNKPDYLKYGYSDTSELLEDYSHMLANETIIELMSTALMYYPKAPNADKTRKERYDVIQVLTKKYYPTTPKKIDLFHELVKRDCIQETLHLFNYWPNLNLPACLNQFIGPVKSQREIAPLFVQKCRHFYQSYLKVLVYMNMTEMIRYLSNARLLIYNNTIMNYIIESDQMEMFKLFIQNINPNQIHDPVDLRLLEPFNKHPSTIHLPLPIDHKRETLSHILVRTKRYEMAKLLFPRANLEIPNDCGWTPLHYAGYFLNNQMAELLIQSGADHTALCHQGYYPVTFASMRLLKYYDASLLDIWFQHLNPKMIHHTAKLWPKKRFILDHMIHAYLKQKRFNIWVLRQSRHYLSQYVIKDILKYIE